MTTSLPSPGADPPTVEGFLKNVLRSGLLDRDALQAILRSTPREQRRDAVTLADHLVRTGHLSRYQARKLLRGLALGLILGPYQILAPIGKGGMSTVYVARDGRNGQLVALKVLPPHKAREEERMLARFRREMELCRRVAHPNLAWTHEAGAWHGVHYIAMEYIPGKNLARLVIDEGPLAVPRAARLMAEVAAGLAHAHSQGLIHRDIKPSNILITPNDHAKVLDLGLALIHGEEVEDLTVVGGVGYIVGTMDYIAPEQTTDSSRVDCRCDIYSLGCTLYFALSGQLPFPGGTRKEKILRQRTDEPTSLLWLRPELPPAFVELVRKAMAKDPEQRFPSAAAIEAELRIWAEEKPGLPLDQPNDPAYAEAVARLRAAEPSTDFSLPEVPTEGGADDANAVSLEEPGRPPWLIPLLVVLGVSLGFVVALIVWLVILLKR